MGKRFIRLRRSVKGAFGATASALGTAAFWIAPTAVGKRIAIQQRLQYQRRELQRIENKREMAAKDRFRGAKWLTSRLSPDSEAETDLETIRDRSRDLVQNDPTAAGYVKGRVTNVVGTGFTVQSQIKKTIGVVTKERAKKINGENEVLFRRWAKRASRCGRKSFWQLMRLAERCKDRDGEAFIVLSDVPLPNKPIPLAIEVVSVTRVATPPGQESNPNVRLGIERDRDGNPVAYFVRKADPNDTKEYSEEFDRIPAERMCHLYEEEEPDQSRGLPDLTASGGTLKDLKDYDEATLIARQVEACLAAIHKVNDPLGASIGAATGTNSNSDRIEELVPGLIWRIGQDEDVEFQNPIRSSGGDHAAYMDAQYHKVAAGLNTSHESLTKNFGKATYSSARAVRLDDQAEYQVGQKLLIEMVLSRVWERLIVEGILTDQISLTAREYLKAPWVFEEAEWVPTGWPRVDKLKEATADIKTIENGLSSRTLINRAHGIDDDALREQRLREAMADADDEKAILDYRTGIGLDVTEEPDPAKSETQTQGAA